MKNQLKGFLEGTTRITTGDKMKSGDHRRDKRKCFHYNSDYCELLSRKCTGSSHCDYYNDGIIVKIIEPAIPNIHTHENLLMHFLQTLKNEINYKSLEGKCLCRMILKKYHLTRKDLEEAKRQIEVFELKKSLLMSEINAYNEKLKSRCILIGLLIITVPFCYAYYQNNSRKYNEELNLLRLKIVDDNLQQLVEDYSTDLSQYKQQSSKMSKRTKCSNDCNERFYARAIQAYKNHEHERFFELILKSIKDTANINAVLFLAKMFQEGTLFEKSKSNYLLLLLYASYLGNKESSKVLGDILLKNNKNSKLGNKFIEKSKQH